MFHRFHYITNLLSTRKKSFPEYLAYIIPVGVFLVFIINAGYVSYPDEFVNLLAGKLILAGRLPYRDFFDHHMPLAWYLGAFLLIFSFKSFVIFRYFWAIFQFLVLFLTAIYVKKQNPRVYKLYLIYFVLFPAISVYYWMHLYIADSLAFLFTSSVVWILFTQTYKKVVDFRALIVSSMLVGALLFSSLSFLYFAIGLYAWIGYLAYKNFGLRKTFVLGGISIVPFIVYLLYLLVTGTFGDFWTANIVYNTQLYVSIPNYTRGGHFNPLKLMLTIVFNFWQPYIKQVVAIKDIDLYFPVATTVAWSTFVLFLVLMFENPIIGIFYFFMLNMSAPRSDVSAIPETDYQVSVYLALGFIAALISIWRLQKIKLNDEFFEILRKVAGFLILVYLIFSAMFLLKNEYDKAFQRYIQKIPSVYDIKDASTFVNEITGPEDKYWIGPYEPHQLFYVPLNQLPAKYPSLLPQFSESEYFSSDFIKQMSDANPAVIIFKHDVSIFNTPSDKFGAFFINWMSDKYQTIDSTEAYDELRSPSAFKLGGDLYIRNDLFEEKLAKLVELGYIQRRP